MHPSQLAIASVSGNPLRQHKHRRFAARIEFAILRLTHLVEHVDAGQTVRLLQPLKCGDEGIELPRGCPQTSIGIHVRFLRVAGICRIERPRSAALLIAPNKPSIINCLADGMQA